MAENRMTKHFLIQDIGARAAQYLAELLPVTRNHIRLSKKEYEIDIRAMELASLLMAAVFSANTRGKSINNRIQELLPELGVLGGKLDNLVAEYME